MYKRVKDIAAKKRIYSLKALFKKLVRNISLNNAWIEFENDEHIVSQNVKRNISMRVRSKHKAGFLTAAEKAIIRTPHSSRTIPERRKLCFLFATLTCFTQITPKLRARLVPVVRLLPLTAGRCIITKSDVPISVYFLLVGEVQMIKGTDSNGNELVEGIFGPGDVIGDVDLLEGCRRTHTFKASTYCELLVLFENDFREILGPYMTKAWDDKKRALKALDYFDFLDKDQIVEACRLGTLKQYSPLDTMYCDDAGSLTNVHFVLSGECLILQCLKMEVTMKKGRRVFRLMSAEDDDTSRMLRQGVKSEYSESQVKRREETASQMAINRLVATTSSSSYDNDPNSVKQLMRKNNFLDIEKSCGKGPNIELSQSTGHQSSSKSARLRFLDKNQDSIEGEDFEEEDYWGNWKDDYEDEGGDSDKEVAKNNDKVDAESDKINFEITASFPASRRNLLKSEKSSLWSNLPSSSSSSRDDGTESLGDTISSSLPVIDSRFIDVGSITFGGIFGLGEQMKHRVVMARTMVQCLTLPRFFLLESKQNPGNIWERRLFYLECMIPSREALFKEFLKTRKWKKFKNNFIRETVKLSDNHGTHVEDIPIMCRIVESAENVGFLK